jgi:anti-sigma B factor antagonist
MQAFQPEVPFAAVVRGTCVSLAGELESIHRVRADAAFEAALSAGGPVIVDLSALTFCDSQGLHALVQLALAAREAGHRVTLRDPRPVLARMLVVTGIDGLFDVEASASS